MEPEDGAHDFLGEEPHPVAALHVDQFVTQHRALYVQRTRAQCLREEHERLPDAERHGLIEVGHIADFRVRAEQPLQLVMFFDIGHLTTSGSKA